MLCIKSHELADHPIRIGGDPDRDGKIMAEFSHELSCAPCYDDRNDQRREDHRDPQWPPDHAPGDIFEQPENDMEVFHFAVGNGDSVGGGSFCGHCGFGFFLPQRTQINTDSFLC